MSKFAHIQTGVGTSLTSSAYYGPFEELEEVDAFVERVRDEYSKLKSPSAMAVCAIDELPENRSAIDPTDFQGFISLGTQ